ncbi:MAG: transposase [Myxococcota bacterium]|nr:transposase [Myxococcota bacterium]
MTFVAEILARLPGLAKPQLKFMLAMFAAFFSFTGRANRTNLARHGAPSPSSQYRWAQRDFDFTTFNRQALIAAGIEQHELVAVMDESFIRKAGKKTHGLGFFYDACNRKARRGLEISLVGLIDRTDNLAYTLQVQQVQPKPVEGSRLDAAAAQYNAQRAHISSWTDTWVFDGAYAKKSFVDAVVKTGDTMVSRLRKDAAMRHLYTGAYSGRGRPKKYSGKVVFDDLSRWSWMGEVEAGVGLYSLVCWHDSLQRQILVSLLRLERTGKYVLLFSTNVEEDAFEVVSIYRSRFQVEFLFREGKQELGLNDCQARDEKGLDFHFNLSLSALNLLRIEELARGEGVLSIASARRRKQNENLMHRLFDRLGLDPTSPIIQPIFQDLRNYGAIAA